VEEVIMRILIASVLLCTLATAQEAAKPESAPTATSSTASNPGQLVIPSGTKVPVVLRNTISTKSNHEGDPVYAQTTFPVVINDQIVIPAGTYVQGRIVHIKPAGRLKNRAEVLMHFTTLIYPSGYTVVLPGALDNAPGVDKSSVKDKEGTIRADRNAGHKVGEVAVPAGEIGAAGGGLATRSLGGAVGGGLVGIAAASGVALLATRGPEVKITPGTTLEVILQRDVPVDGKRIRAVATAARD
jgi:hypothetical protein